MPDGIIPRFERWVREQPSAPAVCDDQGCWTYSELAASAAGIATLLKRNGPVVGEPVAVLLGPDRVAISAILGVLEAGGIVVPLNVWEPIAHLTAVLDLTGAVVLLCDADTAPIATTLSTNRDLRQLRVEHRAPETSPGEIVQPAGDAPCYLLLTSGSTGQPKAVVDTNERIVSDSDVFRREVGVTANDRLSWFGNYALGAQTLMIFAALLSGASLHVYELRRRGVAPLAAWLRQHEISVASLVPSALRSFATTLAVPEPLPALTTLVATGEPLFRSDVELAHQHFPPTCRLVNIFGLTELKTVGYLPLDRTQEVPWEVIPVRPHGRNQRVFLVDEGGAETPDAGELVISSDLAIPGYWRRGEMTRPSPPFATRDPYGLCYHTGDLARLDPHGLLHVLGRRDFQVKVRGQRVELEHVESALLSFPAIAAAAAAVRRTSSGRDVLVAFFVPRVSDPVDQDELRAFLRTRLPGATMPTRLVELDQLPVGASGKLDRKQLPELPVATDGAGAPPRDAIERQVLELWRTHLDAPAAGVGDDFFELGGDSLAAAEIFAKLEAQFDVDLPLSTLLEASTVEEIAAILRRGRQGSALSTIVPLRGGRGRPTFYCVPGAGFDPLALGDLAAALDPRQPMTSFRPLAVPADGGPSIEEIAATYVAELRRTGQAPRVVGGSSFGGLVAFEMALQLERDGAPPALVLLLDTYAPGYPSERADLTAVARLKRTLLGMLRVSRYERLSSPLLRREIRHRWDLLRLRWRATRAMLRRRARDDHRFFDLIGAHLAAARAYVPARARTARTILFRTEPRLDITIFRSDPTLGWSRFAADLEVVAVPGAHYDFFRSPHSARLGAEIQRVLDGVDRGVADRV